MAFINRYVCLFSIVTALAMSAPTPVFAAPGDSCEWSVPDVDCDVGEFCLWPDDVCNSSVEGICTTIPTECPDIDEPVCDCFQVVHRNRCEAYAAGKSVFREGECPQRCAGLGGVPCHTPGQACYPFPNGGTCYVFDWSGFCEDPPTECDNRCAPVCSCDLPNTTYRNVCQAKQEYSNLWLIGECNSSELIAGVRFSAPDHMFWWPKNAALSYNVYREDTTGGPPLDGGDCLVSSLAEESTPLPASPEVGGIYYYQVSANFTNGEGSLGEWSRDCGPRHAAKSCR